MNVIKKFVCTLLVMLVFVYMGYVLCNQQTKINQLNSDITACHHDIQEQNLETEKLNSTIASMSEDEYIEEVARERLGLVMPTEIIFMDASI